jgi:hypothetical protein
MLLIVPISVKCSGNRRFEGEGDKEVYSGKWKKIKHSFIALEATCRFCHPHLRNGTHSLIRHKIGARLAGKNGCQPWSLTCCPKIGVQGVGIGATPI